MAPLGAMLSTLNETLPNIKLSFRYAIAHQVRAMPTKQRGSAKFDNQGKAWHAHGSNQIIVRSLLLAHEQDGAKGFSVVYVLVAALVLIAGSVTLLNRTSSSLFGSIFQGQSMEARDAARVGMSYLISQINREQNRHLLAVLDSEVDRDATIDRKVWTDSSKHVNPCFRDSNNTKQPPNFAADILNAPTGSGTSNYFYINNDGSISKTRGNATRGFKVVVNSPSSNFRLALKENLFLLDDQNTKGFFRLSVEGAVFQSSSSDSIKSSTILQEDFDVIPKCCKQPFGGYLETPTTPKGHGNNFNYRLTSLDRNRLTTPTCMNGLSPDAFGIVVGSSGSGGSINATGQPLIQNSLGQAVNPVMCVSADPTQCTAAYNDSNNTMERVDAQLPPPPQYPGVWSGTAPTLLPCTSANPNGCPSNASKKSETSQLMQYNATTKQTIINATSTTSLPSNCVFDSKSDVHCIWNNIKIDANDKLIIVTGTASRRIRFYFPVSPPKNVTTGVKTDGYILDQTGGGLFQHCKNVTCTTPVTNVTDLSFFGCSVERGDPGCGISNSVGYPQKIDLQGAVNGDGFFIYMPHLEFTLIGDAEFAGVLWVNSVTMQGNGTPIVPASGVVDAFVLLGILPNENNYNDSLDGKAVTTDIFAWDMVARTSNRFRFFGR